MIISVSIIIRMTYKMSKTFNKLLTASSLALGVLTINTASANDNALPTGASIQSGNINITNETANKLRIDQTSTRGIINWNTFDIGKNSHVHFNHASASHSTLNRVTAQDDASKIMGKLTAKGNIMLINPNGVVFGKDSRVDVGGIIASTADISNDAFLANTLNFNTNSNNEAKIRLQQGSQITIKDAGLGAFVAPHVENNGVIEAKLGKIVLGATTESYTLDTYGDGLLKLAMNESQVQTMVKNTGTIIAEDGTVMMNAHAAKQTIDSILFNSGNIEKAKLAVITAEDVQLQGGKIEAKTNLIGGDYLGGSTGGAEKDFYEHDIATAQTLMVSHDAEVKGDNIVLWSDKRTDVIGTVNASDGGFVETSSKGLLNVLGTVNIQDGEWLLDPSNITIADVVEGFNVDGFTPTGDDAIITTASIEVALNADTSVTISTTSDGEQEGNITINDDIVVDSATKAVALILEPNNDLFINANITDNTSFLRTQVRVNGVGDIHIGPSVNITGNQFLIYPMTDAIGTPLNWGIGDNLPGNMEDYDLILDQAELETIQTDSLIINLHNSRVAENMAIGDIDYGKIGLNTTFSIRLKDNYILPTDIYYDGDYDLVFMANESATTDFVIDTNFTGPGKSLFINGRTRNTVINGDINMSGLKVDMRSMDKDITVNSTSFNVDGNVNVTAGTGTFTAANAINAGGAINITAGTTNAGSLNEFVVSGIKGSTINIEAPNINLMGADIEADESLTLTATDAINTYDDVAITGSSITLTGDVNGNGDIRIVDDLQNDIGLTTDNINTLGKLTITSPDALDATGYHLRSGSDAVDINVASLNAAKVEAKLDVDITSSIGNVDITDATQGILSTTGNVVVESAGDITIPGEIATNGTADFTAPDGTITTGDIVAPGGATYIGDDGVISGNIDTGEEDLTVDIDNTITAGDEVESIKSQNISLTAPDISLAGVMLEAIGSITLIDDLVGGLGITTGDLKSGTFTNIDSSDALVVGAIDAGTTVDLTATGIGIDGAVKATGDINVIDDLVNNDGITTLGKINTAGAINIISPDFVNIVNNKFANNGVDISAIIDNVTRKITFIPTDALSTNLDEPLFTDEDNIMQ
jgi:filamentous hemagglutinin family protein